jgi:hypothetical protein
MNKQNPSREVVSKKLTLDRETLKLLGSEASARINGGMRREWSDLAGCSCNDGGTCTSCCVSVNC